jgi:hypothetical protein
MPIMRCTVTEDGKTKHGWKYGESGHCYTGKGGKKLAIKQGLAIQYNGGPKFESRSTKLTDDQLESLASQILPPNQELMDDAEREVLNWGGSPPQRELH